MPRPSPSFKPKVGELVVVRWRDARFDNDYDGPPEGHEGSLATLDNVGYFCSMNREKVTLASCRDASDGTVRHLINIPRKLIVPGGIVSRERQPKEATPETTQG